MATRQSSPLALQESMFHHICLPARLPGCAESSLTTIEEALVRLLTATCRELRSLAEGRHYAQLDLVRRSLEVCQIVNLGGRLNKASLLTAFREVAAGDHILILHVAAQNAGLLVQRQENQVNIEAFEASPRSEDVLASTALQWDFPGTTVAIPEATFCDPCFQNELAGFLDQASTESVKQFGAQTIKSGTIVYESRDTCDPSLITQMLMTLLEVNGIQTSPTVLRKRVRDDVCFIRGDRPWRRSPYWLVLRVGLQRYLATIFGSEVGRVHYKYFVCMMLVHFMDGAERVLEQESVGFLKTKLCRRLAKLESEKSNAPSSLQETYIYLSTTLDPVFSKSIERVTQYLNDRWGDCKKDFQKSLSILRLPHFAEPRSFRLSLLNSSLYLKNIFDQPLTRLHVTGRTAQFHLPKEYDISAGAAKHGLQFSTRYFKLAIAEEEMQHICRTIQVSVAGCIKLAHAIRVYIELVDNSYSFDPEQKSQMLLTIMELWTAMDKIVVELFPLLGEYEPGFSPTIFNTLQLSRLFDMNRLHTIQLYLQARSERADLGMSIFANPVKGCFGERYYNESSESYELQRLRTEIEDSAKAARESKLQQWMAMTAAYNDLVKISAQSTCLYHADAFGQPRHNERDCGKCANQQRLDHFRKIRVHEHPLPANEVEAKTVVFELSIPDAFAEYRDATWRIIGHLALAVVIPIEKGVVKTRLREYPALQRYDNGAKPLLSLASAIKSFGGAHWKDYSFPVEQELLFVPNGMRFHYYDDGLKVWPALLMKEMTFKHHCGLIVPPNSPYFSPGLRPFLEPDSMSSYKIIASQSVCPPGLNVHEFMAFQSLLLGKVRRWPQICTELGSSNLNFSSEATTFLMSLLALQIGLMSSNGPMGIIHEIFHDESFVKRLIEQLSQRLDDLSSNWRETNSLETIITLILRVLFLSPNLLPEANSLLRKAREVAHKWLSQLRLEMETVTDASTMRIYCIWASLLCRRTFTIAAEAGVLMDADSIQCFLECSITLQDNLINDPAVLTILLKNALVRDIKLVYQMRNLIVESVKSNPASLLSAITTIWPGIGGACAQSFSGFELLPAPNDWWVQVKVGSTTQTEELTIQFQLLEGLLLIAGAPVGKLPVEHRKSAQLVELFDHQNLPTYPSTLPGMTYGLAISTGIYGHQVHVGFRDRQLVVRAIYRGRILELVPRHIFGNQTDFDLPAPLVQGCFHWLDLHSMVIEARQQPDIWKSKESNWRIDLRTSQAYRRNSTLVDPRCSTFRRFSGAFEGFELPCHLVLFQPPRGRTLIVELRRLALTFFVNNRHLLQSDQLRAEMDPNQDAGTWYGLKSKIVMRGVARMGIPQRQRSIIVPLGDTSYRRVGPHVEVTLTNDGIYATFMINEVLGRLDCPAEPRLVYLKAHLHAYTSYTIPDPLTGRTGTEEAFHCLASGYSQPWTTINMFPYQSLAAIAALTPMRNYYPKDRKVLHQPTWNPRLTTNIQHDGYRDVVDRILEKSRQLAMFSSDKVQSPLPPLPSIGDSHLIARAHRRRETYRRPNDCLLSIEQEPDPIYLSRDALGNGRSRTNASHTIKLLRHWPDKMPTTNDLAGVLHNWPTIGGCHDPFDKVTLSDLLDTKIDTEWGSLVNFCRKATFDDRYRLMFLVGLMSFRGDANMDAIRTLAAYSIFEDLKQLIPPKWPTYTEFCFNKVPKSDEVLEWIKPSLIPYPPDERSISEFNLAHRQIKQLKANQTAYEKKQRTEASGLVSFLLPQWPCVEPTIKGFEVPPTSLLDVELAMDIVESKWQQLFQNYELSKYIILVQKVLNQRHTVVPLDFPKTVTRQSAGFAMRDRERVALPDLVKASVVWKSKDLRCPVPTKPMAPAKALGQSPEMKDLHSIIQSLADSKSVIRKRYANDLSQSLQAFSKLRGVDLGEEVKIDSAQLCEFITIAEIEMTTKYQELRKALESCYPKGMRWLQKGGMWPCITATTILETLRSTTSLQFGECMKESIIEYAVSITTLQRLLRIEDAYQNGDKRKLADEQLNSGHTNWNPRDQPDWLLLEIDANLLIRASQVDVANATVCPASGSNAVLQMNMGQGKTSCIIPMAVAVLANGRDLMRVIVPKPLLQQTAQLLHGRLGGLIGRELRHIPFSRKTPTDIQTITEFESIHRHIQGTSGVIISLPEHMLSFMLSGLQRLSDERIPEAKSMIEIQNWMVKESRDILDESDYTLAMRTQLIYPSGSQKTVDGHPYRWEVAEKLLELVDGHLIYLQEKYPKSIEVFRRSNGGFPLIFFLRKDAEDAMLSLLVDDVCHNRTSILPKHAKKEDLRVVKQFISDSRVPTTVAQRIRTLFPEKPAVRQTVYLLRGLLVHRILLMTLKKRWNVQYGLHASRDPIAVPFMAKGIPSEQAEWGHPDVAILFTCLSFYYEGLKMDQLRQSLEHILKSDDPSQLYDRVSQDSSLPNSLKVWNSINVDDLAQLEEIWKHLRVNSVIIDYFLNNFVFPKHAKQFEVKLQASGWDIPLFSDSGSKGNITTGFSGTNDSRGMLPLTISQQDLPGLAHTNAEVLTYLLQPRNREYVLAADSNGRHLPEIALLHSIKSRCIRVLIDAGAQILEMDNKTLAKAWLSVDHEAAAAVYFDQENKPLVLYRQGRELPLLASPFADDLSECLVYLDQAHTRGTDLKMPADATGALTLGLDQTKDHTVQAAMRLRQLGTTQSIVFFAPPEVHQSITDLREHATTAIDSRDVVRWLLEQTCSGMEQMQTLHYAQGVDFCRRVDAAMVNPEFLLERDQRNAYLEVLRQPEQQTLHHLYGVKSKAKVVSDFASTSERLTSFMSDLNSRKKGFQDTGNAVHASALQEVEQEREISQEVQTIREVQRPIYYDAFNFPSLHKDLENFAKTGRLVADSSGYVHAFISLYRTTTLGRKFGINSEATSGKLYVSIEFTKTIKPPKDGSRVPDDFQRQVNWILWSSVTEVAIIVVPEEAERLLDIVRRTEVPPTYLLSYSPPVTRKMLHFSDFKYYSVPCLPADWQAPTWLKTEVGIFSGRLYFKHSEYRHICEYLGIVDGSSKLDDDQGLVSESSTDTRTNDTGVSDENLNVFTSKPLNFMQEWLALRRKGQDFAHTPMGHICQGKLLFENHPFFLSSAKNNSNIKAPVTTAVGASVEDESDDEEVYDDEEEYGHCIGDRTDGFDDEFADKLSDTQSE